MAELITMNSANQIFTFTCIFIIVELIVANFGNQIFTFTWRIDNWRMKPSDLIIESPPFVVDFLENTEWSIGLLTLDWSIDPGLRTHVFLKRAGESEYTHNITIVYSLAVSCTRHNKDFKTETISKKFGPGNSHYPRLNINFTHESEFFSNHALIVRCRMSRGMEEVKNKGVSIPIPGSQGLKSDSWNARVPYDKYECSARSRVRVSSKSFVWPIQRIGELPDNVKLSTSLPSVTKSKLSFDFSLYLKEDPQEGKIICIEIHTKYVDKQGFRAYAQCRLKTVGAPTNIQFQGQKNFYLFKEQDVCSWLFPHFLKMKDLTESYLNHTDGTLYLQIDLSFSTSGDYVHTEISEGFPLDIKQREISHASTSIFGKLYRDRQYADVTLRVGDRELKAHKLILITGSDVFRRIFQSGMKEGSAIVDIDNLDPDTVERLLKYLYTEEVEKLNPEDAMKLYYAADKYNIRGLKGRLRPRLIANISSRTVCKTLVLADTHKDEDLRASIVDYIDRNANEVFRSDYWKDFAANHSSLAASSMLQVITRKSLL